MQIAIAAISTNRTVSARWHCWKALVQTKQRPTTTNSTTSAPHRTHRRRRRHRLRAHYRAYGEIARLDSGKIDNPLRFQGQYFDQESGLHYNRHRYYNPDIGRLTPDPVKLAGGINAYQYVPNPYGVGGSAGVE